ncbi:hypothetical protein [Desnuesiella massiliensis]|uniref:hypothetical protein n=1 Tax=Desnuesiella massiliensis TaxID=1650662 RepID=UPI0006E2192E|nr:hypothetical protein [Desnuesiella massiliensis]
MNNKKVFKIFFVIFFILVFIIPYKIGNYSLLKCVLYIRYPDYFLYKQNHSLSDVYNNYGKLLPDEKVALNMIDDIPHKVIIKDSYDEYADQYFKLTNNEYDAKFVDDISYKTGYYIKHYQYYLFLLEFIICCIFIILMELIWKTGVYLIKTFKDKIDV